ncbi:MAG: SRPBCC family protein [Chloroflexota bacterium]
MGRLVGFVVRLAAAAGVAGWLADRWLRDRSAGAGPEPIRTRIDIQAPRERVWDVLADIERQPEWMHDLRSVRLTTAPPVGVGTRGIGRVQAFGISVEDLVEVTAFEAPSHFAIRHEGLVKGVGDIRLVAGPGGRDGQVGATVVTWDETLVAPVLPHLGALVLAFVFRPIFQADLERLARLAESDPARADPARADLARADPARAG